MCVKARRVTCGAVGGELGGMRLSALTLVKCAYWEGRTDTNKGGNTAVYGISGCYARNDRARLVHSTVECSILAANSQPRFGLWFAPRIGKSEHDMSERFSLSRTHAGRAAPITAVSASRRVHASICGCRSALVNLRCVCPLSMSLSVLRLVRTSRTLVLYRRLWSCSPGLAASPEAPGKQSS